MMLNGCKKNEVSKMMWGRLRNFLAKFQRTKKLLKFKGRFEVDMKKSIFKIKRDSNVVLLPWREKWCVLVSIWWRIKFQLLELIGAHACRRSICQLSMDKGMRLNFNWNNWSGRKTRAIDYRHTSVGNFIDFSRNSCICLLKMRQ